MKEKLKKKLGVWVDLEIGREELDLQSSPRVNH